MGARRVIRVQPPVPLGDVTMVPAALSGRAEADMARAMAAALAEFEVPSAADVLQPPAPSLSRWRRSTARVAALGIIMERSRRSG